MTARAAAYVVAMKTEYATQDELDLYHSFKRDPVKFRADIRRLSQRWATRARRAVLGVK